MATNADIAFRAANTTQALTTMGADPIWDAALSNYLRLEALQYAAYEFGDYRRALDAQGWERVHLEREFGKRWRQNEEACERARPVDEAVLAEEANYNKAYNDPLFEASVALLETAAPTLSAALFKVQMISVQDLGDFNEDCMIFVVADMARLAA